MTSLVRVAPFWTVMASEESGCPPAPEPVVIALQYWLAEMVSDAARSGPAPKKAIATATSDTIVKCFIFCPNIQVALSEYAFCLVYRPLRCFLKVRQTVNPTSFI